MTTTSTPRRPKRHHDNTNAAEHALGGVLNARTILTDNDANILRFSDVLQASLGWGPSGATYHWNGYYYLSGTGWSMTWWSPVNTSYYTNTRANFKNTLFCNPFASTYTYHSRDEFRGYTSGSWYWYWTHSKSGDCASLLSSTYYLDTP